MPSHCPHSRSQANDSLYLHPLFHVRRADNGLRDDAAGRPSWVPKRKRGASSLVAPRFAFGLQTSQRYLCGFTGNGTGTRPYRLLWRRPPRSAYVEVSNRAERRPKGLRHDSATGRSSCRKTRTGRDHAGRAPFLFPYLSLRGTCADSPGCC